MEIKNKRGNILTQNIIFIILNLVFLAILVAFLITKMGGAAVLEEKYAKQIALILDSVDSAEKEIGISLTMKDAIRIANKENQDLNKIVTVQDNIVTVRLREKGGYSYSFFNDLVYEEDFIIYLDDTSIPIKGIIIYVGK